MGCNCGKGRSYRSNGRLVAEGSQPDPTRAMFAAAMPTYEVIPHAGAVKGKRFSTLAAAEDYARKTRGILRPIG